MKRKQKKVKKTKTNENQNTEIEKQEFINKAEVKKGGIKEKKEKKQK